MVQQELINILSPDFVADQFSAWCARHDREPVELYGDDDATWQAFLPVLQREALRIVALPLDAEERRGIVTDRPPLIQWRKRLVMPPQDDMSTEDSSSGPQEAQEAPS